MYRYKIYLSLLMISGIFLIFCGPALADTTQYVKYDGYSLGYTLDRHTDTAVVSEVCKFSKSEINVKIPSIVTISGTNYEVTGIESNAFSGCLHIWSLDCPSITIGNYAFSGCRNLRSINCPNVTSIGEGAFSGCDHLESAVCSNIAAIKSNTFFGCISLNSIVCPNIKSIGDQAFSECRNLHSVDCPNVTSIGDGAFSGCVNLDSVNFPNVVKIGNESFRGCRNLLSIECPDVTSIGYETFDDSGVDSINFSQSNTHYFMNGPVLFENTPSGVSLHTVFDKNITSCDVPKNVTAIGNYAFSGCHDLCSISCPAVTDIGFGAFDNCSKLASIDCPAVVNIGSCAFYNCSNLASIDCPNVTTIGSYAFFECSNLTSVNCPNVAIIESYAFMNCNNLRSISCPDITTINEGAFSNCINLSSVFIGPNAAYIYPDSFYNCSNLTDIYFKGSDLPDYINLPEYANVRIDRSFFNPFSNVSSEIVFYRSSEYPDFDWKGLNGTKDIFDCAYITYDANGGSGEMETGKYVLGVESVNVCGCGFTSPANKHFNGWNTKADGSGKSYLLREQFIPDGNMTLYAVWGNYDEPTFFNISYFPGNGNEDSLPENESVSAGSVYTVPSCRATPEGFTFNGWMDEHGNIVVPGNKINIDSDTNLIAQWTLPKFVPTSSDLVVLCKYLMGMTENIDEKYDLNGDNNINISDFVDATKIVLFP